MLRTYDIILAGMPLGGLYRTTPETLEAFKKARVILHLTSYHKVLRAYCKKVIDLESEYWTGDLDEKVYKRIADIILTEAMSGPRVVVVVDGHPSIFQDFSWDLVRRGKRKGLTVRILPALSCIDAMAAFCGLELHAGGLQILEATSIVAFGRPINPYVDALIMQLGWFGTSLLYNVERNKKGRFQALINYLTKYYPEDHFVKLIRAPSSAEEPPSIAGTKLRLIDRCRNSISADTSLFVPAIRARGQGTLNEIFVRDTEDRNYLEGIAIFAK